MATPDLNQRSSGVLLHPTSLPGPFGCGDLGEEAQAFVRTLAKAGQRWWLMLPVGPVGYGNSPYSALSAFAGNPLLLSLSALVTDGLLRSVPRPPRLPAHRVDFEATGAFRTRVLRLAFERFQEWPASHPLRRAETAFALRERAWLPDFSLFSAIKQQQRLASWVSWPTELRDRNAAALRTARRDLATEISFHRFQQWLFDRHWTALQDFARAQGVALIGDAPIFVAHDSADVWSHRELFHLDAKGRPTVVAGVPPDYFSRTGQLWGNPLYRWDRLKRTGFRWWMDRLRHLLTRFDVARIDHFIGFQRYWEIPGTAKTAQSGRWRPGPGAAFFERARRELDQLPLIAEDLGAVTPEVKALRDRFELPGIRILQFAFGTDPSAPDFLPHNYPPRCVVFTGTHDNDTTVGWFTDPGGQEGTRSPAQTEKERRVTRSYVGDEEPIHWAMIRMASLSVANIAIFPVQDLMGLGSEARMNRPGTAQGNWEWRATRQSLGGPEWKRFAQLTRTYGRWSKSGRDHGGRRS
jgi:4-alpha-glucanotransferase